MAFTTTVRALDPVNIHEKTINFTPFINENDYLIKKTGQIALSALSAVSGSFAAMREFSVGTLRILSWVVIGIPLGVIRCFKRGFAESLAKELAFDQITKAYQRGVAQFIGVEASVTALFFEIALCPWHLGANQNYALQVQLGNVRTDQRPILQQLHQQKREAVKQQETQELKQRLGLDLLEDTNNRLTAALQRSTQIMLQLNTKVKDLEEIQSPKEFIENLKTQVDAQKTEHAKLMKNCTELKALLQKMFKQFCEDNEALFQEVDALEHKITENILPIESKVKNLNEIVNHQGLQLTTLWGMFKSHLQSEGVLGESFMEGFDEISSIFEQDSVEQGSDDEQGGFSGFDSESSPLITRRKGVVPDGETPDEADKSF